jgi:hypothetical protein
VTKRAFVYGTCKTEPGLANELARLGFKAVFSKEHNPKGLPVTWKADCWVRPAPHLASAWPRIQVKDVRGAARRNQYAASICNAAVIVKKTPYYRSVVATFRSRNRRVFWWNGVTLREVEVDPLFVKAYTSWPLEVMFEPDRWDMQRAEMQEALESLPPSRTERTVFANWKERLNDVDCSSQDVLHPSNQEHGISVDPWKLLVLLECVIVTCR